MADFSDGIRQSYTFNKTQAPWAVIGDLDGDGLCDLVVDGRSRDDSYRLCVWGSAEGPRTMTLSRRRLKAPAEPMKLALTLVSREELERRIVVNPGDLLGDAFGEEVSGKLTRIYYWRNGHFFQHNVKSTGTSGK